MEAHKKKKQDAIRAVTRKPAGSTVKIEQQPPADADTSKEMTAAQLSILRVASGDYEKSDMVNVPPSYVMYACK